MFKHDEEWDACLAELNGIEFICEKPSEELEETAKRLLDEIHENMYAMALKNREDNTFDIHSVEEALGSKPFCQYLMLSVRFTATAFVTGLGVSPEEFFSLRRVFGQVFHFVAYFFHESADAGIVCVGADLDICSIEHSEQGCALFHM